MVEIKTAREIDAIGAAGRVVADILAAARSVAAPGVTLKELDAAAREILAKAGATSPFLNYHPRFAPVPYPPDRPTWPIAAEMSPSLAPGRAAPIPAARAASVVAISSASPSAGVPTENEMAASPTQPSRVAPASTLSRSPSRSR